MGNVLVLEDTQALAIVTQRLMNWITPLLTEPFHAALTLYWSGFFGTLQIPVDSLLSQTQRYARFLQNKLFTTFAVT